MAKKKHYKGCLSVLLVICSRLTAPLLGPHGVAVERLVDDGLALPKDCPGKVAAAKHQHRPALGLPCHRLAHGQYLLVVRDVSGLVAHKQALVYRVNLEGKLHMIQTFKSLMFGVCHL